MPFWDSPRSRLDEASLPRRVWPMPARAVDSSQPYQECGVVSRRYREAGTPFGITVDSQTLEDHTVTVRERHLMEQERMGTDRLLEYPRERIEGC